MARPVLIHAKSTVNGAASEMRRVATATLPARFGSFRIAAFESPADGKEHIALIRGDVAGAEAVPVRIHSECLTGDVFGSLRCDCREQLEAAMRHIEKAGRGVILYLRQEGRGIGLANKIRAYELQDQGLDTIQANEALGFRADERDYASAAQMLRVLGVRSIHLMSNNPDKLRDLRGHGIAITDRIPLITPRNEFNGFYLETKRRRAGHLLDLATAPEPAP